MIQSGQKWSTEGTRGGAALAYWNEVVCDLLLAMRVDSPQRESFTGEIIGHPIGPLELFFLNVSAQNVRRTPQDISRSHRPLFSLVQPRRGAQLGAHRGREVTLGPGDCILVDTSEPFEFQFPEGSDCLCLQLPGEWLESWLPAPQDSAARIFRQAEGWDRTLTSALLNLTAGSTPALFLPAITVAEQIAALLALAVGPRERVTTSHKEAMLRRMRDSLREHCHDPSLDPGTLAALHGVSRRYVHTLFAAVGTTFGRELVAQRLERARLLLSDRRFASKGIAEIAWSCGFTAPSHFAQLFRRRFGVAPSLYRDSVHS